MADKLKLALVHYRDDARAGGSLRVGETIASHLSPGVFDVRLVFAYGGPGPVGSRLAARCHYLRATGPADPDGWMRSRRWLRDFAPDILHFLDPVYWFRLGSLGLNAKTAVHVHGKPPAESLGWRQRWLNRLAIGSADARICITFGARDKLLRLGWGDRARTYVVHNGVDCAYFRTGVDRAAARKRFGIAEKAKVLGMVCRLVRYRGIQDALRLLRRLDPPWVLLLCGDGPFRRDIESMARSLGVADRVHFAGSVEDVRPVYAAMDVFLFLARYDSFGLATCEAMAANVPVVGLAADGEYREPQYPLVTRDNATLIERAYPTDYDAVEPEATLADLEEAVRTLLQDADRRNAQTRAAREWVEERFSGERQAAVLTGIYRTLVGKGPVEEADAA